MMDAVTATTEQGRDHEAETGHELIPPTPGTDERGDYCPTCGAAYGPDYRPEASGDGQ